MWITAPSAPTRSMAILTSASWARCIGFRVWKATTLLQPFFSIMSRICTAVRNVSGNSSAK